MTPDGSVPMHIALEAAAKAARSAFDDARWRFGRAELAEEVGLGADGTPTMRIDAIVEEAILDATATLGVNVLSEEAGFVDVGSAVTLVVDPVDGSANAAAGLQLCCFSAALAVDDTFTEALTVWLASGDRWGVRAGEPVRWSTSGRSGLDGAAVSLLRPQPARPGPAAAWWRIAERAARVRVLGCTTLDAAFVAQGSIDAFADAGSDTHRLVDLAAALLLVPAAGGAVIDALGRPIELDLDLTRRWSGVVAATPALAEELATTIADAMHTTVSTAGSV